MTVIAAQSDHLVQSMYSETFHPKIDGHLGTSEVVPDPAGI